MLFAQTYTTIPDSNFEQALIDIGIDAGSIDGRVLTSNINTITDLYVISRNITSLTGIHDFKALITLNCAYNKLSNIDISSNTELISLDCSSNQIASLNLANNANLSTLICSSNLLSALNILAHTKLTKLNCSNNQLSSLDVSKNTLLTQLTFASNQFTGIDIGANTSLLLLDCANNRMTGLDINNNTLLATLFCASNQLEVLDLSKNSGLTMIDCSSNQIASLDVINNLLLTYLTCSSNQLSLINLTQNDSLIYLDISNNQLSTLDVSKNDSLVNLLCTTNQLKSMDFSNNSAIEKIDLSVNQISDLDLSANVVITSINCSNNLLNSLNIKNGNNEVLEKFNATENPYLKCIEVDNQASANSNLGWEKDNSASYHTTCVAYTYVPDNNFETALVSYDDIASDNYVPTANIQNLITLDVSNLNISDLTGIEDFISLETLNCSTNKLFNLDMSNQPSLKTLNFSSNSLVDLTLKNAANAAFINMDARNNPKLSCIKVDNVAAASGKANWFKDATATYNLNCISNKTYIPDDNFEAALIELGFDKGALDNYVVTDSINTIQILDISNRNIFDLTGIANFVALDSLNCSDNKLNSIDISANVNLKNLDCRGNYLTNLDVQSNTLLIRLLCGDNNLSVLDVSKNLNLKQLNCNSNYLKNIGLAVNVNLQELNCNTNFISTINLGANINIKKLYCSNNKLTAIDLTNNTLLKELDCASNLINQLNLSTTKDLIRLDCSINNLSTLDLSKDTVLENIKCNSNQLTTLNLNKNPLLRVINCSNNRLTSINLSNGDSIREITASNNKLTSIALDKLSFLSSLNVIDNQITSLDLTNNDSLQVLLCSSNRLNNINISSNLVLRIFKCNNNLITNLDINNNTQLVELNVSNNSIGILSLSNALNLKDLLADYNNLITLDLTANNSLTKVSCANNELSSLDFSNLIHLTSMNCSANQLTSLYGRNGSNALLEMFNSTNNPNLRCIEIDNAANIGSSWVKDVTSTFTVNCHYGETYIPDDNFEAALSIIVGEASNNNDNYISTSSINTIISLNISNKGIANLTGLDDFTALTTLNCSGNLIDSLNVYKISSLTNLNCANNQIDSLGLSSNTELQVLNFSSNLIYEIDLANQAKLTSLICNNNSLTSLDLRQNPSLTNVNVSGNQLITLHVNNGNNSVLAAFNATNNPGLFCIEVDDPNSANSGAGVYSSWQKDAIASYSDNCHYNETFVPDDAFEQALKDLGYDNGTNPLDDYVPTPKINKITYLNIANLGISDLTGIEDFTALVTLNCANSNLTSLDLSNNLDLVTLICSGNNLSTLNISLNTALKKIDITDNLFTSIDFSNNTNLERLLCSFNQLSNLNILSNTALVEVNCSSNQLLSVDANNGNNQNLQNFDLRNNPNLRCILVDDINAAAGYTGWYKDPQASYKIICDDDDNDGVSDAEDLCTDTPFGDFVDIFGCSIFTLPANNFTVLTKSETCRDANNGIVNISAIEIHDYTATLIGAIDTVIFKFTNAADIRNLRADNYNLCITIEDKPDYSQCFQVYISQPDDLKVKSQLDNSGKSLTFKMSGGTLYTIDFNGLKFNTTETELSLNLENGQNMVKIMADAACQGVYEKSFFLSDKPAAYPNPFDKQLNIYTGKNCSTKVDVKIYSYSGKLLLSNTYQSDNGSVEIITSGFKPGVYYVWMKSETLESTIKIVKE